MVRLFSVQTWLMAGCGCVCGMCAAGMHSKCYVHPHYRSN